jgi:hypothetical protein
MGDAGWSGVQAHLLFGGCFASLLAKNINKGEKACCNLGK